MKYLATSAAMDRLEWLLDGLNGAPGWGGDAADVLAPAFAALVPPDLFAGRVRQRAAAFAPLAVTGLDTSDHAATARIRVRDDSTLADATGRELRTPVFAADWLLGSLTPFGGYHQDRLLQTGAELLTTLAFRQLTLGQSAILDYPAEDLATRTRQRTTWRPCWTT